MHFFLKYSDDRSKYNMMNKVKISNLKMQMEPFCTQPANCKQKNSIKLKLCSLPYHVVQVITHNKIIVTPAS